MNTGSVDVQAYLTVTAMCDYDNPWFQSIVDEVITGADTPEAQALRIFYYVRDNVRFGLAYSRSKASQTLKRGYGDCLSKSNVQVALLRATGIPARLRVVQVQSAVLHHLIVDWVYKHMPAHASHFWPECYLNGRWISCEAFLDKPLYAGMLQKNLITKAQVPIDWDGKTDLVILRPWITEDRGSIPSADAALAALQTRQEGMPPILIERIIAPVFYPLNLRKSDKIRRLALAP